MCPGTPPCTGHGRPPRPVIKSKTNTPQQCREWKANTVHVKTMLRALIFVFLQKRNTNGGAWTMLPFYTSLSGRIVHGAWHVTTTPKRQLLLKHEASAMPSAGQTWGQVLLFGDASTPTRPVHCPRQSMQTLLALGPSYYHSSVAPAHAKFIFPPCRQGRGVRRPLPLPTDVLSAGCIGYCTSFWPYTLTRGVVNGDELDINECFGRAFRRFQRASTMFPWSP